MSVPAPQAQLAKLAMLQDLGRACRSAAAGCCIASIANAIAAPA